MSPVMLSRYQRYGDILLVDTTFGTNRFRMSLLVLVGVDCENKNTSFGFALLDNEREDTFVYIFEGFLNRTQRQPTVIFSDQCHALVNAITKVFTQSRHFLCSWHIGQNVKKHFHGLLLKKLGSKNFIFSVVIRGSHF